MAAYKAKQDDLRRLMKERRENAKVKIGKIESPFAKYNSIGQLSCTICNVFIKNNNLWGPHVAGKVHKENLLKPKKTIPSNDSLPTLVVGKKRPLEETLSPKKAKSVFKVPEQPQSSKSAALLPNYASSDESDNSDSESQNTSSVKSIANNTLPSDFFDNKISAISISDTNSTKTEADKQENVLPTNQVETLPEGFFDDPVLDAKARNIEYKDPAEEEWELFQKTIAEETNVSKTLIEEDLEESTLERGIEQIDEQIHQWERVKNLQVKADDVKVTAPQKNTNDGESGASDDELEEDDLLDWRSKGVKKL